MASPSNLIGGRWRVETGRPLPGAGGGLPAFVATDTAEGAGTTGLMAVRVAREAPARAGALATLQRGGPIGGILLPLGFGSGFGPEPSPAAFVICLAPPGAPVIEDLRPWPEHAIIDRVLKPAALALESLRALGTTHRAIRPNNVFGDGQNPAVLGCAWAAPPAFHQPGVFEPPYSAACAPAARGTGSTADDIYALGVLLLTLALGRVPLAALAPEEILHRKLQFGSHATLTNGERLPAAIMDLTRGMLAEDPEHRPHPALLADSAAARARRVTARMTRRAQRPLEFGGRAHWHSRTVALACAEHPKEALSRLLSGEIDGWVRRGLGDSAIASKLDEAIRTHQAEMQVTTDEATHSTLLLRAVSALDPLLPPCWRGVLLWPDALGAALAAGHETEVLIDLIACEGIASWQALPDHADSPRIDTRRLRGILQAGTPAVSVARLRYETNPLLPCAGRIGAEQWVIDGHDLLPALERLAGEPGRPPQPIDLELAAFAATRLENLTDKNAALSIGDARRVDPLQPLRVTATLQQRLGPASLPALAAWLAAGCAQATIASWPSKARRAHATAALQAAIAQGHLSNLVAILADPAADFAEHGRLLEVRAMIHQLDDRIATLSAGTSQRRARAEAVGQSCATAIGSAALGITILLAML